MPRRVQGVPGAGGVAAVMIHLANLVGDGIEVKWSSAIGRKGEGRRPATDSFVVAVSDRHVDILGLPIGGGTEDQPLFADAQAPRVVVG